MLSKSRCRCESRHPVQSLTLVRTFQEFLNYFRALECGYKEKPCMFSNFALS